MLKRYIGILAILGVLAAPAGYAGYYAEDDAYGTYHVSKKSKKAEINYLKQKKSQLEQSINGCIVMSCALFIGGIASWLGACTWESKKYNGEMDCSTTFKMRSSLERMGWALVLTSFMFDIILAIKKKEVAKVAIDITSLESKFHKKHNWDI